MSRPTEGLETGVGSSKRGPAREQHNNRLSKWPELCQPGITHPLTPYGPRTIDKRLVGGNPSRGHEHGNGGLAAPFPAPRLARSKIYSGCAWGIAKARRCFPVELLRGVLPCRGGELRRHKECDRFQGFCMHSTTCTTSPRLAAPRLVLSSRPNALCASC
ncbi:hypothetical protein E2C01_014050 [Portunus trituberculatus]|uniref:Uncharacterized protein n=1 Tax=Portunus trituberculatus TaxID=210409 RepID=A0A5B7DIQ6_PORTR|nr:hypothetical protein [Portunus trituberculatus]